MQTTTQREQPEGNQRQSKLPLFISIGFIISLVGAYFLVPSFQQFVKEAYQVLTSEDKARISGWVSRLSFWGPIMIILAMIAQMFLFVVPTILLMVISVLAYGPFWGTVLTLIAVVAASSVAYMIGAYLGPVTISKLMGDKTEKKMENYIDRYGLWAVIIVRISPFLSNDAVSFISGLVRMGYWKFIGATLIGITPLALLIAYLGESNDRLKNGLIWVSVISIIAFAVYVWYDQYKTKKQTGMEVSNH